MVKRPTKFDPSLTRHPLRLASALLLKRAKKERESQTDTFQSRTDQLRRIGGGGNASVTGTDANLREQRVHTTLLKQLVAIAQAKSEVGELKLR